MVEINNKIISYFFVGVLVVLTAGYIMSSGGSKIISGYAVSNDTNSTNCYDSDGGINYYTRGQVDVVNSTGIPYSVVDECVGIYGDLREYYCGSVDAIYTYYSCPDGCMNGACNLNTTTTTSSSTSTSTIALNQTGNLYVSSKPTGASVYLDGIYKAKTNTTIKNLFPKSYSVKLTRSGYVDWTTNVWVYSGQTSYVNAILLPNKGNINITSIPSGARIYLDSSYKGTTNRILSNIVAGNHNIKLNKTGYNDYFTSVAVYANMTSQVNAVLIPNSTNR